MLRTFLVGLCGILLRVFFRRIEVVGKHHLPQDGAIVLAFNHPSGLIDPLFALCLTGRRVSFLAKEPLFRMPLVGLFVRAFESLPVYRAEDGADPANNRKMMLGAAELLSRGNALALFPEGTSHSDPSLKRFRSGAARIALSARALGDQNVWIVPGAIYYEKKQTFRSRAVLSFGDPIEVPKVQLDDSGESPRETGHALTKKMQNSINALMPTANTVEGLVLAEQAERVLSRAAKETPEICPLAGSLSEVEPGHTPSLGQRMTARRRIIDAYLRLTEAHPERLKGVVSQLIALREELDVHGLPIDAPQHTPSNWKEKRLTQILVVTFLTPVALVGYPIHLPTYYLVHYASFRYAGKDADVMATVKLVAGMLFFPISWIGLASLLASWQGNFLFLAVAAFGPFLGWVTILHRDATAALLFGITLSKRAKSAPLNWTAIKHSRGQLAEEIAELLSI